VKVQFDLEEVQAMANAVIDQLLTLDGLSKADRAALRRWKSDEVRPASPTLQLMTERLNEEIQRTHDSSEVRRIVRPDWV
jgi:hypothetical protein